MSLRQHASGLRDGSGQGHSGLEPWLPAAPRTTGLWLAIEDPRRTTTIMMLREH